MTGTNGKGSRRRPGDADAYRRNWQRIFGLWIRELDRKMTAEQKARKK